MNPNQLTYKLSSAAKTVLILMIMASSGVTQAGSFDCSVIYDEYDSLMNKNFIIRPSNYVRIFNGKVSRTQYNGIKTRFTQSKARKNWGVAVYRTNKNSYGKFRYTWGAPFTNGHPSLILRDVVRYGRVLDAYQPKYKSKIVIPSSFTVDLDNFRVTKRNDSQAVRKKADLWFHNVNGTLMYAEQVNGANVYFPKESMCR